MKISTIYKVYFLIVPFSLILFNTYATTRLLKIKIANASYSDEIAIRFMPGATIGFDGCCDAWKLFSENPAIPHIFTRTDEGRALAINSLPLSLNTNSTVDIFARIEVPATYTIIPTQIDSFSLALVTLIDNVTGNTYILKAGVAFTILLPRITINTPARFTVHITTPVTALVKLTKFTARAQKQDVLLAWTTTVEENNGSFFIERAFSTNADAAQGAEMHFVSVGVLPGGINSHSERNYEYTDHPEIPLSEAGALYYRLKQINPDGSYNYFGPIAVMRSSKNEPAISVYPAISNDTFFISGDINNSVVRVYALSGRIVYSQQVHTLYANEPARIEMQNERNGIYLLRVIKDGNEVTQRIILKHLK